MERMLLFVIALAQAVFMRYIQRGRLTLEEKMKVLQAQFEEEKSTKIKLEKELEAARKELEEVEYRYPIEVASLRDQIEQTKRDTA